MSSSLLDSFATIPDPRRAQGKMDGLAPVLLVSVLAVLSGATSCRSVDGFSYALKSLRANGVKTVKDALWKNAISLDRTLCLKGLQSALNNSGLLSKASRSARTMYFFLKMIAATGAITSALFLSE